MVVAARVCDIVAGAGGHLHRWNLAAVLHATRSPHQQALEELAGLPPERVKSLNYAAQDTPAHLSQLTAQIAQMLAEFAPAILVTHAYEGGDCDGDAVAFAVHHSIPALRHPPVIVEMTGCHSTPEFRSLGEFLQRPGVCERLSRLSADEQVRKVSVLSAIPELHDRVSALDSGVERFRVAPRYDFLRPPHPGPLLYEQAGGRWTGETWRAQAARVLPDLAKDEF
jgi:hypothetical protein